MMEEELCTLDEKEAMEDQRGNITWGTLLSNKGVFFALLTQFFGTSFITFNSGYMPTQLASMGFAEDNVGFVLGGQSFIYLVTCLLYPYTCETIPRKLMFVVSILGMTVCMLMMGPSSTVGLPVDNYYFIIIAFPIIGLFQTFVFIPVIPEMIEQLQHDLEISEGQDPTLDGLVNDKVNDAYGFFYASSMFVAPLLGSEVYTLTDA